MLIKERLETTRFSNSEQVIVDYLLKEQLNIENKSTTQIAKETFSSKSTIVKVAQKLNFPGWSDFKKAYLNEMKYFLEHTSNIDANYPFEAHSNYATIAKNLATVEKQAIDETLGLLDYHELQRIIQVLLKAEQIHVLGLGNNLLIAKEFEYNMTRIRKKVKVYQLLGEGMLGCSLASKKDCAIIISYSGETKTLLQYMAILQQNQVPTILITNIGDSTLARNADYLLRMSTRERLYSKIGTFANDTSIIYLLDLLYSCVFKENYQKNLDLRITTSKVIETTRQSNSKFLRED